MTNLELNAAAEGLFKYICEHTKSPLDDIAIIGLTLLKIYDHAFDGPMTIDTFANDFKQSLIGSYKARKVAAQGNETVQ